LNWVCGEQKIRDLWALDPSVAFLNHGSYGAVPLPVQQHRSRVINEIESNPANFLARHLPSRLMQERRRLATWLNVAPESLAFVPKATSGIGAVLSSIEWTPGDEIVFHSHGYGWVRQGLSNLAARHRVVIRDARIPWPMTSDDLIVEAFQEQLNERTRLLICDHVSSPTALTFPLERNINVARAQSVQVLIDGAHAPGYLQLDLETLDPDFYTGNLHKWVCAPRGAALDFNAALGWDLLLGNRRRLLLDAKNLLISDLKLDPDQVANDERLFAMLTVPWPLLPLIRPSAALAREMSEWLLREHQVEVPVLCFEDKMYFRISAQAYNRISEYQRLADAIAVHPFSLV
jgi:selenocysteine lyase/cysteine desulfurase